MNNKNKIATLIASVVVGAAVVTGSVYAAVTASQDKEEIESTEYSITTETIVITEATTEPESSTTEPATNNSVTTSSTLRDMQSTVAESNSNSSNGVTKVPFRTQEQLDAEYIEYLDWLKEGHERELDMYKGELGTPPRETWNDGTPMDEEIYKKEKAYYDKRLEEYNRDVASANERYEQALKDAKIKYNQP